MGLAIQVSALFNLFSRYITFKKVADIKSKQVVLYNHMQTLDDKDTNNHNDIEKIATSIGNLYEYTHTSFQNLSK